MDRLIFMVCLAVGHELIARPLLDPHHAHPHPLHHVHVDRVHHSIPRITRSAFSVQPSPPFHRDKHRIRLWPRCTSSALGGYDMAGCWTVGSCRGRRNLRIRHEHLCSHQLALFGAGGHFAMGLGWICGRLLWILHVSPTQGLALIIAFETSTLSSQRPTTRCSDSSSLPSWFFTLQWHWP